MWLGIRTIWEAGSRPPDANDNFDAGRAFRNGIVVEGFNPKTAFKPMHLVYRKEAPPGPAGRAFIAHLRGGA